MAGLILRKEEFFLPTHRQWRCRPLSANVLLNIPMSFCELVLVWRGNGLHVLNDRPWRITRGDLFYIRAEDKHSYALLTIWFAEHHLLPEAAAAQF